jgi:hypothetical protein
LTLPPQAGGCQATFHFLAESTGIISLNVKKLVFQTNVIIQVGINFF